MNYFAYGMNTSTENMSFATPVGRAVLKDWEFQFSGYADVQPSPGSEVEGVLWRVTSLGRLDTREGYPHLYDRVLTEVLLDGVWIRAYVYTMVNPERDMRMPSQHYLEECLRGYKEFGLDGAQIGQALVKGVRVREALAY